MAGGTRYQLIKMPFRDAAAIAVDADVDDDASVDVAAFAFILF